MAEVFSEVQKLVTDQGEVNLVRNSKMTWNIINMDIVVEYTYNLRADLKPRPILCNIFRALVSGKLSPTEVLIGDLFVTCV